jgi:hypothetical protein
MGAYLHGYNGVNPKVGIQLWNMYVSTRLLFGLESVVLKTKDYTSLNLYHKSVLKNIQNVNFSNYFNGIRTKNRPV